LEEFCHMVYFDAAVWISGSIDLNQANLHRVHYFNFPTNIKQQIEKTLSKHLFSSFLEIGPHELSLNIFEQKSVLASEHRNILLSNEKTCTINHAILIGYYERLPGMMYSLILYRTDIHTPFTTNEISMSRFSVALMQETKHYNLSKTFIGNQINPDTGVALCDLKGFIREADSVFLSLLGMEFPDWEMSCLNKIPEALLRQQNENTYIGEQISIWLSEHNGFILLQARKAPPIKKTFASRAKSRTLFTARFNQQTNSAPNKYFS